METIRIICTKRANFYKPESGGTVFRVLYQDLNHPIDAPAWIQKTETFADMRKEGTVWFVDDAQEATKTRPVAVPVWYMDKNEPEPVKEPEGPIEVATEVIESEPAVPRKRTRKKKGDAE